MSQITDYFDDDLELFSESETTESKHKKKLKVEADFRDNIILIYSNKGGTGKTSITHQLVKILEQQGKHILIIDNDQQENLTQQFITPDLVSYLKDLDESESTIRSLLRLKLAKPFEITEHVHIILFEFLRTNEDSSMESQAVKELIMNNMQNLSKKYDYILIDCNPAHLPFTKFLIQNIPKMIYLMDMSEYSRTGFEKTLKIRTYNPIVVINKIMTKKLKNEDMNLPRKIDDEYKSLKDLLTKYNCKTFSLPFIIDLNDKIEANKLVTTRSSKPLEEMDKQQGLKYHFEKTIQKIIMSLDDDVVETPRIESRLEIYTHPSEKSQEANSKIYFLKSERNGKKQVIFGITTRSIGQRISEIVKRDHYVILNKNVNFVMGEPFMERKLKEKFKGMMSGDETEVVPCNTSDIQDIIFQSVKKMLQAL